MTHDVTDPGNLRETIVRVRVKWDPEREGHPLGWDWSLLLACEAEALDSYEAGEGYVEPPEKDRKTRRRRQR